MSENPNSNYSGLTCDEREIVQYLAILTSPVPFGELSRQMSWRNANHIAGIIAALLAKRIIRGVGRGYELTEPQLTWLIRLTPRRGVQFSN